MSKLFIYYLIPLFCIVLFFNSCRQHDCPVNPSLSTVEISGSKFIDVHLPSNSPNYNGNVYNIISAVGWTQGGVEYEIRNLLKFDYSDIPQGSTIVKATLRLYYDTSNVFFNGHRSDVTGPNNFVLQKVTTNWDNTTVTWNTQPPADASVQIEVPPSTSNKQNYEIDITALVKDEFENPSKAFGFLMKLVNPVPYNCVNFASTDHSTNTHPTLEIDYIK